MAVSDTDISIFDQARVPLNKMRTMLLALMKGQGNYAGTSSGASNVFAISLTNAPAAYELPIVVIFTPHQSSAVGGCVVNLNGLGNKSIVDFNGAALGASQIVNGIPAMLFITTTNAVLMNPSLPSAGYGSYTPATLTGTGTLAFSGGTYGGIYWDSGPLRFFNILIQSVNVSGTGTRVYTSLPSAPSRRTSFPAHIYYTFWSPALSFSDASSTIHIDNCNLANMPNGAAIWFEVNGFYWK